MKKFVSLVMIAILSFSLICPSIANAATLKINYTSADVVKGNYLYLKVTGTTKKAKWKSSDETIAYVSSKGKVTTQRIGNATIYATIGTKKLKCRISVISKPYIGYLTDSELDRALAMKNYIDDFSSETAIPSDSKSNQDTDDNDGLTDAELRSVLSKMLRFGFATSEDLYTELGKAYMHFCDTWVGGSELKNYYFHTYWDQFDDEIYLFVKTGEPYIIKDVLAKPVSGTVYEFDGIRYQYLEKFECNGDSYELNEFYFNREDLIKKGFILN